MANEGLGVPDFNPTPNPAEMTWSWVDSPIVYTSTFSRAVQTLATFGGFWRLQCTWRGFERNDLAPIVAQLNSYGTTAFFTTYLYDQPTPRQESVQPAYSQLDTLKIVGGGQTGNAPLVDLDDGLDTTSGTILEAGDIVGLSVNGVPQMFQLSQDFVVSNGTGFLPLSQALRASPADNAQIITRYVPFRVRLSASPSVDVGNQVVYSVSATFDEVVLSA